jgi:hypothetical protein
LILLRSCSGVELGFPPGGSVKRWDEGGPLDYTIRRRRRRSFSQLKLLRKVETSPVSKACFDSHQLLHLILPRTYLQGKSIYFQKDFQVIWFVRLTGSECFQGGGQSECLIWATTERKKGCSTWIFGRQGRGAGRHLALASDASWWATNKGGGGGGGGRGGEEHEEESNFNM